jgi:8-oxo-dGTP pyrophosphatase MutT (NUDIX family)
MLPTIRETLRTRDGYDDKTIDAMLREFNEELAFCVASGDLEACEYLLQDHFGLEPDYLFIDPEVKL